MNKNAIKTFAINARNNLISAVKKKAYEYGIDENGFGERNATVIDGRPLSSSEVTQRAKLVAKIQAAGFEQVMEEAAYTWFNRFIALRYMEVNRYLPSRIRVFTNEAGEFDPEILKRVDELDFIGEQEQQQVYDFIENSDRDGLFKFLIITQCNALHDLLPAMFEEISDYTELLFPSNLLLKTSVLAEMVSAIPEEDWLDQVQIIGWLYQYYIAEPKDERINAHKKYKREDVPFVTQLFTSDWIVRFMVENSLGRLWYEGHPDEALKSEWKYYLDEAEQEAEVQTQLDEIKKEYATIKPEEIKIIDPSMGSGHVLVYAFDVLMQIYRSQGWSERDAAKSIVENNLYGIDIDKRAYQLAYFAVMMKARSYSRRILTQEVKCNLCAIEESNELNYEYLSLFGDLKATATAVADEMKDAREYGSILIIKTPLEDLLKLQKALEVIENTAYDNFFDSVKQSGIITDFKPLLKQAIALAQKYDVVVTNPPYMNASLMPDLLKKYVNDYYADYKSDMFAVFTKKTNELCKTNGHIGLLMPYVWMFISSYEKMRIWLNNNLNITSLVQLEYNAFEAACVPVAALTLCKTNNKFSGEYVRLSEFKGSENQAPKTIEAVNNPNCGYRFRTSQTNFKNIPGTPIAYWVSDKIIATFTNNGRVEDYGEARKGLSTGSNDTFLRHWFEPSINKCDLQNLHRRNIFKKWVPINKGGNFRKWYGNNEYLINWENDGFDIKSFAGSVIRNPSYYFKESITWTMLSASCFGVRYSQEGKIFEGAGPSLFVKHENIKYILSLLCSKLGDYYIRLLNPTININIGDVTNIPVIINRQEIITNITENCIMLSKQDWDSFETSWDFKRHPLV